MDHLDDVQVRAAVQERYAASARLGRGKRAPDVEVGPDCRVPGGAVDLRPVGDVEHPQPLAGTGDRQRPVLPSGAAASSLGSAGAGSP